MMQRTSTAPRVGSIQNEIGWARIFLSFLREAEGEADQLRLRGLGVRWKPEDQGAPRASLRNYFQVLGPGA